uniref:rRNA N-glycosidase n=1 Tax=Aegilops tauschii TaxID=37682 RepID=M8C8I1_AEGTA
MGRGCSFQVPEPLLKLEVHKQLHLLVGGAARSPHQGFYKNDDYLLATGPLRLWVDRDAAASHCGATIADRDDPGEAMRKKFDGMREKLESAANSEDWNSVLRIVEKLILPPDSEPRECVMKLDQDPQKIAASQAKDWLVNKLKKQNSVPSYENPVLKYSDLQQWIHKLSEEQRPVSLALGDFKLDLIEMAFLNPSQEGSLSNFISYFSDRLCNNDQNFTFRHGKESCHLLEYQTPNKQQPRWMLIKMKKDNARAEIYIRSDHFYLCAFSSKKGEIFELVKEDCLRIIKSSVAFGCSTDYPSILNYERPRLIPEGECEKRLLDIILNMEEFSHGIEVLSNYDHSILSKHDVSEAEKQQLIQEVQEALAWNVVVLAEVSCIIDLFVSVNGNWKESCSSLTKLLYEYMMHWKVMLNKARNGAIDAKFEDNIVAKILLRFRCEAIKVLNLLCNAKGPGIIKNGEDGKGSEEDSGPSRGNDKEQKTSGSSSGLSGHGKDKETNTPGSGPLDSYDDNLEGDRDGGKQKENYNDSRPGTSEMSKIAMAFMGGLIVGKNWVQPLINKRSMEPFVITKRGVESLIISRRSVEPLMVPLLPDSLGSAYASGLGQVLSLVPDSSMSSHESLVLKGPSRPMTAHDGYWIIQTDVPVESSFEPEHHPEIPGRVLYLNDDFLDKPRGNLISIRGGLVNITSVTFSNAVRSSIRFLLCSHQDGSFTKVEGELILSVENYPFGFTIFKNQVEDDAVHFVRQSGTVFELPLTRHVLALPIGSRVHVLGTLKLATLKVLVDQYLVLDKNVAWAGWTVETGLYAAICIEASSFL